MKTGPKPSYLSASLIAFLGLLHVGGVLMVMDSKIPPEKAAQIMFVGPVGLAVIGTAGLLALIGGVAMFFRNSGGFAAAGIGMLVLSGARFLSIHHATKFSHYAYPFVFAFLGIEALQTLWRHWQMKPRRDVTARTSVSLSMGSAAASTASPARSAAAAPSSRQAVPANSRPSPPPPQTLSHLDAGDFAPLTPAELLRRARKVDRALIFRFGLRNQIPPASDERTLLIDKALVAHGILTPERLKEIHELAEFYLRVRPTVQSAAVAEQSAATRALADDAAERAAIREQKRAESAARKAQHAADVSRRKATDIVFLGRGVSGGLGDRRANVEKLTALGLPVLTSPAEIATALGLSIPRLRWLAFHSEAPAVTHYVRFTIPKKSGGTRELAAPHHDMAAAQQWILINILERVPVRDCAHGFVRGRSIMSNAVPHVRREAVVNADLKDFFPSITFPRVKGIFEGLGYSAAAATVLALLCTECPRRTVEYAGKRFHAATGPRALPQGACTSPALSNLAARKLDARLAGLAAKTGWTYTRYADDLTFSADGDAAANCGGLLTALRRFCTEENFTVNEKKTRVQRRNTQQTVTGIVVNHRPNVPRDVYRRVRAILHQAQKTGLAAQNRSEHPNFPMHVRGLIAWVHMANPERGKKLRAAWDRLSEMRGN